MGIYKKDCLKFQSTQGSFFKFFSFAIYRMVDSEYIIDIYKSVESIGTVMKNPEMLRFVLESS